MKKIFNGTDDNIFLQSGMLSGTDLQRRFLSKKNQETNHNLGESRLQ